MTAHLLSAVLTVTALSAAPECAGCSLEQKELIADLCHLLDEFVPDPEDMEEAFEALDLEPPPSGHRGFRTWARVLLPTVGLKIQLPLAGPAGRHVVWEVFLFFNLSR